MAFQKKTWKDRITEFPTRRTLTKSDGSTELVTVARAEGTVSQEGDAFNAASMNDLEERINQANNDLSERINSGLSDIDVRYNSETGAPEWSPRGADTWSPFRNEPVLLWKGTGAKQNNITCTFDYSPYTHIRIDFKDSKSLLLKCGTTPIVLAEWSAYYSNSIGRRLISFISSGITCNTLDASGNGGAYMIPLEIYGIK